MAQILASFGLGTRQCEQVTASDINIILELTVPNAAWTDKGRARSNKEIPEMLDVVVLKSP